MWHRKYSIETQEAMIGDSHFETLSSSDNNTTINFAHTHYLSSRNFNSTAGTSPSNQPGIGTHTPALGTSVENDEFSKFQDDYTMAHARELLKQKADFSFNELDIHTFKERPIGRDDEIQDLTDSYQRTKNGKGPSLVAIKGATGTGKTTLAHQIRHIHKETTNKQQSTLGFVCSGQYSDRNEPYTGISQALSDLIQQLSEKDSILFVNDFKKRIESSIGDDMPILLSFIPNLKKLGIGTLNNVVGEEVVNIANKAHQLHSILQKFIKVVCDQNTPFVLVLDDIHWADPSSLLLITALVTDIENKYLQLITTSHPDKINDGQLISTFFETLQSKQIIIDEIELNDLIYLETHEIICTALRSKDSPKVQKLSKVVHDRTNGNPFFLLTFLQSLVQEDLLDYNLGTMSFTWDLDKIRAKSATANVAELALSKLEKLDPRLQSVLQVSSCLSNQFTSDELFVIVAGMKKLIMFNDYVWPTNMKRACQMLCNKGIFLSHNMPSTYSFAHGQIQAAAFKLVPVEKRGHFKLAVGQQLIKEMDNHAKMEKYLCLATDLCNASLDVLPSSSSSGGRRDEAEEAEEYITQYAKWNLLAGELSQQKGAHPSALKYFEIGINCLGRSCWSLHPKLALALHCGAVEACYCTGDFEKHEKYSDAVLFCVEQTFTAQECMRIHTSKISVLIAQEQLARAVSVGQDVIKQLGIADLPKSPGMLICIKELMKSKRLAKGMTCDKIVNLATCTDKKRIAAMNVISLLSVAAYIANPNLLLVMFMKSFRWTIKYGITQYSPAAVISYGIIVCNTFKDPESGMMFGKAALELAKTRNLRVQRATTISAYYGYIYHALRPLRNSLVPLAFGYQLGLESGEIQIAFLNLLNHDGLMLLSGAKPLPKVATQLEMHIKSMDDYKQDATKTFALLYLQYSKNLIGDNENIDPIILTGSVINEDKLRSVAKQKDNKLLDIGIDNFKCQLAYLFGDYESASKFTKRVMDVGVKIAIGSFHAPRNWFIIGLVHAALVASSPLKKANKKHLKIALLMKKRLYELRNRGNTNVVHMLALLEAEISALKHIKNIGKCNNIADASFSKTQELYKDAILSASRGGFVHDRALAHERAAYFYIAICKDDRFWPCYHLKNAIQCYRDWGATKKVEHLLSQHAIILETDVPGGVVIS